MQIKLKKLDIRVGDVVFVEKGGEIIPKIMAVDFAKRSKNSKPTLYITHCPECNTELVRQKGDAKTIIVQIFMVASHRLLDVFNTIFREKLWILKVLEVKLLAF